MWKKMTVFNTYYPLRQTCEHSWSWEATYFICLSFHTEFLSPWSSSPLQFSSPPPDLGIWCLLWCQLSVLLSRRSGWDFSLACHWKCTQITEHRNVCAYTQASTYTVDQDHEHTHWPTEPQDQWPWSPRLRALAYFYLCEAQLSFYISEDILLNPCLFKELYEVFVSGLRLELGFR